MNFTARKLRPTSAARFRSRLLGATVGVLVAIPFGAVSTAAPAATDVAPTPSGPAATIAGPAAVAPAVVAATPPAERVPAVLRAGDALRPSPVVATLTRSAPVRVRIPAIGVDSDLIDLGLQQDGRMEVPNGPFPAGWYTGAPTPGELGPAILAGHVDHGGVAGVFYRLRELRPDDTVEVTREDGSTAVFRVTAVEQHAKDAFPTAAVYGDIDHAGLRLITCGGPFDRSARSYEDNIVVFAELDAGATASGR